ncbi:SPX domain-containing protein [Polychytrium aggregatum]|uniref:SPX domain-containing protein n=1 Tax=Polychytrium aggregatum TaxID=110093 RepID=UPI0022FE63C1|nr:SPX domain-containing protein [Polychytrium aggregatum]KAI9202301.1 SPX domain-containing protein [Polychytrium aggregatum]
MKFSHSIQLNSSPEWVEYYLNYSNLKKLIYAFEKASLGLAPMPTSLNQLESEAAPAAPAASESTPLLTNSPSSASLVSDPDAVFTTALDEQLEKINRFYRTKERDLFLEVEALHNDLSYLEAVNDEFDVVVDTSALSTSEGAPEQPVTPSSDASFYSQGPWGSVSRRHSSQSGFRDNTERRIIGVWSSTRDSEMKQQRKLFRKKATELFVILSELQSYVELNYTGFTKILKKYEKVTGRRLKRTYLQKVESSYSFRANTKASLAEQLDRVIALYARIATEGRISLAKTELQSNLRELIVWERNTIWRDLIEHERKSQAIELKPAVVEKDETERGGQWSICGLKIALPFVSAKPISLLVSIALFGFLLAYPILDSPEQQNCLAILVLASSLWAFECTELFVTAILVPLLVVGLRVLREPVVNKDGSVSYVRMSAKPAAKKIFSDMFSPVIMLLLGGFTIAAALTRYGIAKNIAAFVLGKAGSRPSTVLLANMFVSTFASMWISNVAAPVLCISLIQPILRNLPRKSPYAKCLILGIAMAANVGGMASPISSPQNIIAMSIMQPSPSWLQWFMIALPVCIFIDILIWALLRLMFNPNGQESADLQPPELFQNNQSGGMASMSRTQFYILFITMLTIFLWCIESQIEQYVGEMGVIAILPILALFGTGILPKDELNAFLWPVVLLAMGGTALGKAVESSGLLTEMTQQMAPYLNGLSVFWTVVVFSGLVLLVTSFISHTVGALIILPVVAQVGATLPDPRARTLVMATTLMCSGAMGLPVSSFPNMNAISQEDPTGVKWLSVADFLSVGVPAGFIAYAAIIGIAYPIMEYIHFG